MKLNPVAHSLWVLLTQRPGRFYIEEIVRDVGVSKNQILIGLNELEDAGLIRIEEVEYV